AATGGFCASATLGRGAGGVWCIIATIACMMAPSRGIPAAQMAMQAAANKAPGFRGVATVEGRRLLALPGVVAVVCALATAAISFAILVGATPIIPDETTTLALIA